MQCKRKESTNLDPPCTVWTVSGFLLLYIEDVVTIPQAFTKFALQTQYGDTIPADLSPAKRVSAACFLQPDCVTHCDSFASPPLVMSQSLVVAGVAAAVASTPMYLATALASYLGGKLSDRLQKRKLFAYIGGGITAIATIALAFIHGLYAIILVLVPFGAASGIFLGVELAMAIDVLPNPA